MKNTNDVIGRRTAMARSGSVFGAADTLSYLYNDRSEVTGANSNAAGSLYHYAYSFDNIGNRLTANLAGTPWTYTANNLNQYSAFTKNQVAETPSYDDDGNMLTRDGWIQTWNAENRLIKAEKGTTKLEFAYDYMGRRIFKKVYSSGTLTQHTRFVYDGYKLMEELDALNNNAVLRRYAWSPVGLDVPVSVYDAVANSTYYYHTDANKNITELTNASGSVVAHYEYSPFGKVVVSTGAYANTNPFRFSSEYHDDETGLVYYNYRYYSPELGRWLSRDPIEEEGGMNLYGMVENNTVSYYDIQGLKDYKIGYDDPEIKTDAGAGKWNSEPVTIKMRAIKHMIQLGFMNSSQGYLILENYVLPDAFAHLKYYLSNQGGTYKIRFEKMISDLKSLSDIMKDEISEAQNYIENLKDGYYDITSKNPQSLYACHNESMNWFYAVGGYSVWGKGHAKVFNNQQCFELQFEFKFFDRYNWDKGKSTSIVGITVTDKFMGSFHRQGIAREFDMIGSVKKTIRWKIGEGSSHETIDGWKVSVPEYRGGRYE